MLRFVRIARLERAAVVARGTFVRLLGPGTHLVWGGQEVVRYDLTGPIRLVPFGDPIPADAEGQRLIEVSSTERALALLDGRQTQLLAPGRYRVWEGVGEVAVRRFDVLARPVPLADDDRILVGSGFTEATASADVALILRLDGQPLERLPAGRYRVWTGSPWSLQPVGLGLMSLEVAPQDLVTADQIPLRLKPTVTYRVVDPLRYHVDCVQAAPQLYAAVQLAMRDVVASRTLDGLLSERPALEGTLLELARARLPEVGIALERAAVKDIVLPGDVKELLSKVTLARKEAEALAIRRREEVAATRQLANTAKLLEKNPVLTRLKELEALGELVSRIDRLTVVGGPAEWIPRLLSAPDGTGE